MGEGHVLGRSRLAGWTTEAQRRDIYQDPPVGVPCLEAERLVVWGSSDRRVLVYICIYMYRLMLSGLLFSYCDSIPIHLVPLHYFMCHISSVEFQRGDVWPGVCQNGGHLQQLFATGHV